jgi:protein-S-isoprenylcysteine O-methyltransferase Ste14
MSDPLPGKRPILPPVYFLVAVALMACLHLLLPGAQLIGSPLRYSGLLLAAAALGLVLWAAGHFRRRGTTIKPFQDASALVLEGPYRLTRNSMYMGLVGILFGLGVLLGSASPFVVVPVFVILVDVRFIRAEEAALHRTFGAAYSDYKARVRRWV